MNDIPKVRSLIVMGIFLLIFSHEAVSQFSFYKNYTVNDGLPSSKIYDMILDSKGYIWFATENGVSRFDGYEFKNLTTNEGLPTNSTLKLYEDYKGRIWFLSYQGIISYYEEGEIIPHWMNDSIHVKHVNFFDNIYVDSANNIWATPLNGGLYKIGPSIEVYDSIPRYKRSGNANITLTLQSFKSGYILGIMDWFSDENTKLVEKEGDSYNLFYPNLDFSFFEHKKYLEISENNFYVSFGNILRYIVNDSLSDELIYPKTILDIYLDQRNNLWISTNFDGVYMYPNNDLSSNPTHILEGYSVSRVFQDKSANYWFSTTNKGVFQVPSFDFKSYNKQSIELENEIVYSMAVADDEMFVSTNNKKLYSFQIEEDILTNKKELELEGGVITNINDIFVDSKNTLWVTSTNYLHYTTKGKRIAIDTINNRYGYEFMESSDNKIFMAIQNGFNIYKNSKRYFPNKVDMIFDRTFTIHEGLDGTVWMGNLYGVFTYKDEKVQKFKENDPVLSTRISDIKSEENQIWIGTFDNGLAVIDDSIIYINENHGLSSNRIKVIYIEDKKSIWVGTNNGLNHIVINEEQNFNYSIDYYTIWDGLPSNEINDILKLDDVIWLGTDKGIVSFFPAKVSKIYCTPTLYFESISIQGQKLADLSVNYEVGYNEHNVTFNYKAICYKNPGNVTYAYKLNNLENDWILTKNTSIRYSDLAPEDYKFIVKAKSIDGIWSDTIEFDFRINKHYTQTAIFKIVIVLLAIGLIAFVFWIILKNQKNRETLKQQVILAEQKAIRSQMNPHFLFNSLNSIQHLILNKEGEVANYYLTNLSKLMRRILDNSKHTTIPLKDELENIQLYLDLEKFRFENHFDYQIEICDSIKVDEMVIPSMIIQPYLENAIWHGLVPKEIKGVLKLSVKRNEKNDLLILVEDNGIGRIAAEKIANRRKNYKSMGMKNTKERMQLLNRLFKKNYNIEVVDLFNEKNGSNGTRIEITIDV